MNAFSRLARAVEQAAGSPYATAASVLVVVIWAVTGPLFDWSDTWQLVINTGTTVVTFWVVFLIQAAQNRESAAVHVKLDELLRAVEGARNRLILAEDAEQSDLDQMRSELQDVARKE